MTKTTTPSVPPPDIREESPRRARFVYADVLQTMLPVAVVLCLAVFLLYVSGVVAPLVPLSDMPSLWKLGAAPLREAAGLEPGWAWVGHWRSADVQCLIALGLLAAVTPIACFAAAVQYFRRRELLLAGIALVQVAILLLAMSGLVVAE